MLLAVVTLGAACRVTAPQPSARPVSPPGAASPTPATSTKGALPEPAGPSSVLERTACFGDCPVYRLEIRGVQSAAPKRD